MGASKQTRGEALHNTLLAMELLATGGSGRHMPTRIQKAAGQVQENKVPLRQSVWFKQLLPCVV